MKGQILHGGPRVVREGDTDQLSMRGNSSVSYHEKGCSERTGGSFRWNPFMRIPSYIGTTSCPVLYHVKNTNILIMSNFPRGQVFRL